ncbi:MAG TPA: SMP-30/gluconolactonase/LRE family protein [Alphaproteobacteria bacterium]|nr:SMP-30/gluconolactonase/LRE family protein [Alphaproteobacteria bacterium]
MNASSYEIRDPRFKRSVQVDEPVEKLWTGGRWTEGPVYSSLWRSVIFSDIPNDRRLRYDELTGAVGDHRSGLGCYTNGSTLDREGRLVMCNHGTRSVTRIEHDGRVIVLADRYQGKRFNSPNDVVVKSDGSIWFTDPSYGIETDYEGFAAEQEQDGQHVYRIAPSGEVTRVTTDFVCPNGLAFSLDESILYIVDSGGTRYPDAPRHIRAFRVEGDKLKGGEVFATCEAGVFDGFRLDKEGRIWTSTGEGIHIYHPDKTLLGKIFVPEEVSNLTFGGPKRNRLYITASSSLYTVLLSSSGPARL